MTPTALSARTSIRTGRVTQARVVLSEWTKFRSLRSTRYTLLAGVGATIVFAIIPALFVATYPQLNSLNIMKLHSPQSAVLSAVIFNALVIIALIPLALRGVRWRPSSAVSVLRRNVFIYGVGGVIVPFVFIKIIDLILTALHAY